MPTVIDNRGGENQRVLFSMMKDLYKCDIYYEYLLPNGQRYDIFVPLLGLAIEYDGEQHSQYIEHFHRDINGYIESKRSDLTKDSLSRQAGVKIVRIKHNKMPRTPEELKSLIMNTKNPEVEYDITKIECSNEAIVNQRVKAREYRAKTREALKSRN